MSFSPAEVDRIARLARLALTPDELAVFPRQLAEIVSYARQVCDVATDALPDAAGAPALSLLRDDVVEPSLDRADVIDPAPVADAGSGLIKVPRVLG